MDAGSSNICTATKEVGHFSIDLFASFQNTQLRKIFSWKPNPNALALDALAQQWNSLLFPYAFPPFALIGTCLQKVLEEEVHMVLVIAPVWPAQHWYLLLLQMLVDYSVLHSHEDLILNPHQQAHPLIQNGYLTLAAWLVSEIPYQTATFQKTLCRSTMHHGENQPQNHMTAWNLWTSWCKQRSINPISASLKDIIQFLTEQFHTGKQYITINTYRSTISSAHPPVDGTLIGKHPQVHAKSIQFTSTLSKIFIYLGCGHGLDSFVLFRSFREPTFNPLITNDGIRRHGAGNTKCSAVR